MRICIPGQVVGIRSTTLASGSAIVGIPINCHYDFSPSLFYSSKGRDENDCCHAKLTSFQKLDGKDFIMAGCTCKSGPVVCSGDADYRRERGWNIHTSFCLSYPVGEYGGLTIYTHADISTTPRLDGLWHENVSNTISCFMSPGIIDGRGYTRQSSLGLMNVLVYGVAGRPSGTPGDVRVTYAYGDLSPYKGIVAHISPGPYSSYGEACESVLNVLRNLAHACVPVALKWAEKQSGTRTVTPVVVLSAKLPKSPSSTDFLLDEWDRLSGYPIATSRDRGYALQWLKQHAYLDAVQSAPSLSDNTISNILELVGFVKDLVHGEVTIPKRWQDAWLAYRYQYMTTKLDIQEAVKFAKRMSNLSSLDAKVKSYGTAHYSVHDTEVTCRCKVEIKPKSINGFDKLWGRLSQLGLAPDTYVIWDMTPFSFMVDWLIPVGDVLDVFDTSNLTDSYWDITNVTYSLSYTRTGAGYDYPVHCYTRWTGDGPLELNGLYWLDKPSASSKVKLMRLLDTASLFIGG